MVGAAVSWAAPRENSTAAMMAAATRNLISFITRSCKQSPARNDPEKYVKSGVIWRVIRNLPA